MKLFQPFRASRMKRISVREAKRRIPEQVITDLRHAAGEGESVLWVAKDPDDPYDLRELLQTLGYRTEWANNGPSSGWWVRW